jgi:hypothetical protein
LRTTDSLLKLWMLSRAALSFERVVNVDFSSALVAVDNRKAYGEVR